MINQTAYKYLNDESIKIKPRKVVVLANGVADNEDLAPRPIYDSCEEMAVNAAIGSLVRRDDTAAYDFLRTYHSVLTKGRTTRSGYDDFTHSVCFEGMSPCFEGVSLSPAWFDDPEKMEKLDDHLKEVGNDSSKCTWEGCPHTSTLPKYDLTNVLQRLSSHTSDKYTFCCDEKPSGFVEEHLNIAGEIIGMLKPSVQELLKNAYVEYGVGIFNKRITVTLGVADEFVSPLTELVDEKCRDLAVPVRVDAV